MADIFDEVSEDLRQDKLYEFWKKFSKYIISSVVLIVISVFGYQGFVNWEKNKLNSRAETFFDGLINLENDNLLKSLELFKLNVDNNPDGYLMLSFFGLAETNFKNGNVQKMIQNYKDIYNNNQYDIYYRNLARFLSVIKDNISSYEQLHDRLKPILNSPSKLQSLAAELEIVLLVRFDMIENAQSSLTKLLSRKEISMEQKNRLLLINKIYQ